METDTQAANYEYNFTYEFLSTERARKHFADTDFALRSGKHIQNFGNDFKLWDFVNDYYDKGLSKYYMELLGMVLKKEFNEREAYFFLDFPEEGSKGKFGYDRTYALDDRLVIFAILLLNLYKEKFFENKEVKWDELLYITEEGENKDLWQKLLFGENKRNFTPTEKEEVRRKIERTLQICDRMGWIRWLSYEDLHFEIMPSIDRIAKLYQTEINNVELLTEYLENNLPS
jgi:chromosome condensin MukBEF MukE localization factor